MPLRILSVIGLTHMTLVHPVRSSEDFLIYQYMIVNPCS